VVAALVVLPLQAGAAGAQAPKPVWKGWSNHGRSKAWITPDFQVRQLRVGWKARCRGGRNVFVTTTEFRDVPNGPARPDREAASPEGAFRRAFADHGNYRTRAAPGLSAVVHIRLRGTLKHEDLNAHADGVYGRFRATVTIRRKGRVLDRCVLRHGRFEAYTP
jgi:hypothetical protein